MGDSSTIDLDSSSLYNSEEYEGEEDSQVEALVPPPSSWFDDTSNNKNNTANIKNQSQQQQFLC